jgi:hypothetical protein
LYLLMLTGIVDDDDGMTLQWYSHYLAIIASIWYNEGNVLWPMIFDLMTGTILTLFDEYVGLIVLFYSFSTVFFWWWYDDDIIN